MQCIILKKAQHPITEENQWPRLPKELQFRIGKMAKEIIDTEPEDAPETPRPRVR